MVRIVNPPTLHVILYNTEAVSMLSTQTTHTVHVHTQPESLAEKLRCTHIRVKLKNFT